MYMERLIFRFFLKHAFPKQAFIHIHSKGVPMEKVAPSLSPSKLSHRKGFGEKYGKAYSQAFPPP